ncbi:hypothetical protein K432DRAFT_319865 [Lepidopterella palustris CBS 459.81]|uniref:Uncharacterized protein n=1 Tax=Lepidopterella palustris CBS 459.81 TaxID=1314670 RepID=A0A8E2JJJ0_9PEZI|nr:hypothetical protein K432DRAFT_319865 [Lepidopterella palustris CBS 459.81]
MLSCKNYHTNCSVQNGVVAANPDIAGIGVIISFLVTTCLAFVLAFVVMSLERYNEIDAFVRKYITKKAAVDYSVEPYTWRSHKFWFRILGKNLMAFSDTQLLTGMAIQFTALLEHCEISVYHFKIVTELAFLTTVTHLLALVALRNYFVENKWVNLPRVIFMFTNLGLLAYTSYIAYSYTLVGLRDSSSLACFYQGHRPHFKAAFAGRWGALLVGAIGGHISVFIAMYFLDDHKAGWWSTIRNWVVAPIYAIYGLVFATIVLRRTQALGTASVNIDGSEKEWGFGQFLPVLLLALPLLAGWESFWEENDEVAKGHKHFSLPKIHSGSNPQEMTNFLSKRPTVEHNSIDNSALEATIESHRPSPVTSPDLRPTSSPRCSPRNL